MSPRSIAPVLAEILAELDFIARHTRALTIDTYKRDLLVQRAVERSLEIISEAVRHLPEPMLEMHSAIPWKQIKGFGSVMRHEYFRAQQEIIWNVIETHLPPLRKAIAKITDAVLHPAE
jgi:uncharacterized protein with HEPN domain